MAMSKEEYQQWKDHPLTQQFHQFLADYRKKWMEQWASGDLTGLEATQMSERCQMAAELISLPDDWIDEFYRDNKQGAN